MMFNIILLTVVVVLFAIALVQSLNMVSIDNNNKHKNV